MFNSLFPPTRRQRQRPRSVASRNFRQRHTFICTRPWKTADRHRAHARARATVLSLGCWSARARALHFFLTTTSSYHVVAQFKSMSGTIMVSYHPSLSLSLSLSRLKVIQKLKTESLTFLHFSPLSPHRRFVDRNRRNDDDDGGDDDQFLKNSNC